MKYFFIILLTTLLSLNAYSQQGKKQQKSKDKAVYVNKKNNTDKKKASKQNKTQQYTTAEIKDLQSQRTKIQKNIKNQQNKLQANKTDVKQRLQTLININGDIDSREKEIITYQNDIKDINSNIEILSAQKHSLENELEERKKEYMNSVRYLALNRNIQEKLMFVFSAKSLTQAYRRLRFVVQYATYQKMQGEAIKDKQEELNNKNTQLSIAKNNKNKLLNQGQKAHAELQVKQTEQQNVVVSLQKEQKIIQSIIDDEQKKQAGLNAQIDKLIAIEVEKARVRAAEEARKKAELAAAEKKKRAEEARIKKEEAERKARENAQRIKEAKEKEKRLKEEAEAAKKANSADKQQKEQLAKEAQSKRQAAERKADMDNARAKKDIALAERAAVETDWVSSIDKKLNGTFERNKGRLPIPITGSYKIVSRYGQYNVEGLPNVRLDNKGINILGQSGAQARAIFDGEVSSVFSYGGTMVVMVRHGSYISVYCNLRSVSVNRGQKISARQTIGVVGNDNILQFQLRKETAKLNPEQWLGR